MSTCRDVIVAALNALGVVAPGDEPTADELDAGLVALTQLIWEIHASRGPLTELDVSQDFVAAEDQRLRVQSGFTVTITLANSVPIAKGSANTDYGHGTIEPSVFLAGTLSAADNRRYRLPRDGSRVEVVGVTQALYFYRSDVNAWISLSPLEIDGPTPLNARYDGAIAPLIAERMCDSLAVAPSTNLIKRIGRGNAALMMAIGDQRRPTFISYL